MVGRDASSGLIHNGVIFGKTKLDLVVTELLGEESEMSEEVSYIKVVGCGPLS